MRLNIAMMEGYTLGFRINHIVTFEVFPGANIRISFVKTHSHQK